MELQEKIERLIEIIEKDRFIEIVFDMDETVLETITKYLKWSIGGSKND